MRGAARWIACAVLAASTFAAGGAPAAGPSDACFDAYERAQRLRKEGHLRATREKLLVCAASTCPAFVARDCTQWIRDVERMQPQVIFGAKDERGGDLANVQVFVDGEKIASTLDGRPQPMDPGRHAVRYVWGTRSVELEIVLAEGALRHVDAEFKAPAAPTPTPAPPAEVPPHRAGAPTATWVLGGLAVLAAGSFVGFALAGKNQESCAPKCSDHEISVLRRDYLIADVSLLVGLVAAGGALYFWLTRGTAPPTAAPAAGAGTFGTLVRF